MRSHIRPAQRRCFRLGDPRPTDHREGIQPKMEPGQDEGQAGGHQDRLHHYRQDAVGRVVLGWVLTGPGSGLSEEPALGCESVALESETGGGEWVAEP